MNKEKWAILVATLGMIILFPGAYLAASLRICGIVVVLVGNVLLIFGIVFLPASLSKDKEIHEFC